MIMLDSSIWIDHLRHREPRVEELLALDEAAVHPLVIEELAVGSIPDRTELFDLLRQLPFAPSVSHEEAMRLIEGHRLWGRGLGTIDVRLLGSAVVSRGIRLWTRDRRLHDAATELGVAA